MNSASLLPKAQTCSLCIWRPSPSEGRSCLEAKGTSCPAAPAPAGLGPHHFKAIHPRGLCGVVRASGSGGVRATLTPDHPGLNRVPQDLRNPGASSPRPPRGAAPLSRCHHLSGRRAGLPGEQRRLGRRKGRPEPAPSRRSPKSRLCSQQGLDRLSGPPAGGGRFPKDWCPERRSRLGHPHPSPTLPPEASLVPRPLNTQRGYLPPLPRAFEPQEAGEYWNVRCLRSEPQFDWSWAETRGEWPRTTRSLLHFQTWWLPGPGFQTKLALAGTSAAAPATRHIWIRLGS